MRSVFPPSLVSLSISIYLSDVRGKEQCVLRQRANVCFSMVLAFERFNTDTWRRNGVYIFFPFRSRPFLLKRSSVYQSLVGEVVGARGASLGGPYGAAKAHCCVAVDESRSSLAA